MRVYDLAYLAAVPVVAPILAWRRWRHGKYRHSGPGMLGRGWPNPPIAPAATQRVWMHSVSVGETVGAGAVFRELRRQRPDWEVLSTTTTETGHAQARTTLAGAEHFAYAPLDFSWNVARFHDAWRPSAYVFFETEVWPNALLEARRRRLPVFLVNGKLSAKSAAWYRRLSFALSGPLSAVHRFLVQTEHDAERFRSLLPARAHNRVIVTGNVKFDALPNPLTAEERRSLRASWGAGDDTLVVVAGSTHPTEEDVVADAFAALRSRVPDSLLVIAPRHPERFGDVEALLAARGLGVHRTTAGDNPRAARDTGVVLLDEMRVLARRFGGGDIALLGGSWARIGGHNLLEPAVHAIPVLRGPHMHAQREIVRVLGPDDGAPMVEAADLGAMLIDLAEHPDKRRALGERAARAAAGNRGAAKRVVDIIVGELG